MIYSRMKFAMLGGNGGHDANVGVLPKAFDLGRQQDRIGSRNQHSMRMGRFAITPHFGAEWQNWQAFASIPSMSILNPTSARRFDHGPYRFASSGVGIRFPHTTKKVIPAASLFKANACASVRVPRRLACCVREDVLRYVP